MKSSVLLFFTALAAFSQNPDLSGDRIRAHVKFLASDLLEGRGVGSRGGDLATEYIATQLELLGAKPANGKSYFQPVALIGAETKSAEVKLTAHGAANAKDIDFHWGDEFVGGTLAQKTANDFDAEAIFVGHGISAPEYDWDDYRNIDVKGKVVVLFTNEPPSTNDKFFDGRALTYYGRWTYKYEEAARRGAVACIIVHTTPTAGYGWPTVQGSWSKEDPEVRLAPGAHALSYAGWISNAAGEKFFAATGHKLDDLLKSADTRGFKAIPLGIRVRGHIPAKIREISTRNVAGIIPGSDPQRSSEIVLFTAHWDHLGIGPAVNGDEIYNGAVDNATGCAMLLEMAHAWAALPHKPRRSAMFLFVTAEEAGLLGSEYYGTHPLVPLDKTAVNLNFDAFAPFGVTKDISATGAEKTSIWPLVQSVAKRFRYDIKPDPRPEQGSYFRSDHFSIAKYGVPAFSIESGDDFWGKPAGYGQKLFDDYNEKRYHQPSDQYDETWDFTGMRHIATFGFTLGMEVANQESLPARLPKH